MTGQLNVLSANTNFNAEANVSTRLVLGEPTTLRGDAQDTSVRFYGEQGGVITFAQIIYNGSNLAFTSTNAGTAAQFSTDLEVTAGGFLGVRDAGATDFGRWNHDGTNFILTLTNTANYNITGISTLNVSAIILANEIRLSGDVELTSVRPTVTWIESDAAADNGVWDVRATGEDLLFRTLNDAGSVAANYMRVERTGTTIDLVSFPAPVQVGALEVLGNITINNTSGILGFFQSGTERVRISELGTGTDGGIMRLFTRIDTGALTLALTIDATQDALFAGDVEVTGNSGFNGTTPISQPTVTGSRASNAALASLLTALANYGLIVDSSS